MACTYQMERIQSLEASYTSKKHGEEGHANARKSEAHFADQEMERAYFRWMPKDREKETNDLHFQKNE